MAHGSASVSNDRRRPRIHAGGGRQEDRRAIGRAHRRRLALRRAGLRLDPSLRRGRRRRRGEGRAQGVPGWAVVAHAGLRARPLPYKALPSRRAERHRTGRAGIARYRQADPPGPRRRDGDHALLRVLRRRRGQDPRRHDPVPRRLHRADAARAARGGGGHHPLELSAADPGARCRRGARHGQHAGRQAGRGCLADGDPHGRARARGRHSRGRLQRHHRLRPHGWRSAVGPSRRRLRDLHWLADDRHRNPAGGRDQQSRRDDGAGRKVAADRVRRCRHRGGPAGARQRYHSEWRPDLFGRQPRARRAPGLRGGDARPD